MRTAARGWCFGSAKHPKPQTVCQLVGKEKAAAMRRTSHPGTPNNKSDSRFQLARLPPQLAASYRRLCLHAAIPAPRLILIRPTQGFSKAHICMLERFKRRGLRHVTGDLANLLRVLNQPA